MRASGILMPISSLPSAGGIGCFSKEAYEFADALAAAGQRYWQILPLGPTGYGDSPYQSFSAFAGNPYFIDPQQLEEEGLLTANEVAEADCTFDEKQVDYGALYQKRFALLRSAFHRFDCSASEYLKFKADNAQWLEDYSLYMAVKADFGGSSWNTWDEDIRLRRAQALESYCGKCSEEQEFICFQQYEFYRQWKKLKAYANGAGVKIIGDIPIYVAFDGADSWAHPEMFQYDENEVPTAVAGCPPDAFSADGQLWGNPLYDWDYQERSGYVWWKERMKHCFDLYDVVRVDHFRGFDEYYAIPYGDDTAVNGKWMPGPGMKLFEALKKEFDDPNIIAEDLGYVTDSVVKLVSDSGFPGMKVLEFAFDSREGGDYMPYRYTQNCVVYTGTHDNQTLSAWYDELAETDRQKLDDYLQLQGKSLEEKVWSIIRLTLGTVADTAIIPMQDYLCLGAEARMNHPSTLGANWKWRMTKQQFTKQLQEKIRKVNELYGRC